MEEGKREKQELKWRAGDETLFIRANPNISVSQN